jgi:aspartate/methionine/tyrosine aminotransferase
MFYELAEKALELEKSGEHVIRLNVGDTNLPTPQCAVEAAIASIKSTNLGYGQAAGILELREKIAEREQCDIKNVAVGPGSKHLIYGLLTVLAKGCTVTFPSPSWPAYELACGQLNIKTRKIESTMENEWQVEQANVAGASDLQCSNHDILILCNPLNPTSTIYRESCLNAMLEEAQRKGKHVILDEAYKGLAFGQIPKYENAIRVRSFSKEFNMENWRIGYVIAPESVVQKLLSFLHTTTTCEPVFVQMAALACLENERELLTMHRKIWEERSEVTTRALEKIDFKFVKPEAGIYVFAQHEKIKDSEKFALDLLEKEHVAVAPGTSFGSYKKFIRICVNQDTCTLKSAVERIGAYLAAL